MAKVTAQGVVPYTTNQYFTDLYNGHKAIDSSWNLDPSSPDGMLIAMQSEYLGNLDEYAVEVYNSRDPNQATGTALDDIATITGIERFQAAPSNATLTLTGVVSTVVPAESQITNDTNGSVWRTLTEVILPATVEVESLDFALVGVNAGDTWTIATPISGWVTAQDATDINFGRALETDDQLRNRRTNSVSKPAVGIVDSIYSNLANLLGVTSLRVYENVTNATTGGVGPHSIRAIVQGGDDNEIADIIYNRRSIGSGMTGAITIPHTSPITGNIQDIRFDRPTLRDVYVKVTINNASSLGSASEEEIKQAIIAYATGGLFASGTYRFNTDGYKIGEDVASFSLVTPVNAAIGEIISADPQIYITALTTSNNDSSFGSVAVIGFDELATFTESNIDIIPA